MPKLVFILLLGLVTTHTSVATAKDICDEVCGEPSTLPAIDASYGAMRLRLILQAGFDFLPDRPEGERNSFTMQRARVAVDGHLLSENLTYLLSANVPVYWSTNTPSGFAANQVTVDMTTMKFTNAVHVNVGNDLASQFALHPMNTTKFFVMKVYGNY